MLYDWSMESNCSISLKGIKSSAAHFAKQNTKFGGGESEGEAGIHFPHTPFSARLARSFSLARGARHQFCSKKVRAFSNKGHQIGLRDFLEAKAIVCSPRRSARRANLCFPPQKITKSIWVRGRGFDPPRPLWTQGPQPCLSPVPAPAPENKF